MKARSPFIALDGEAIDDAYVMLCSSTGAAIENADGLPTDDVLWWLQEQAQLHLRKQRPLLVGFAFQYDVNMILRDVDLDTLRTLWETSECVWRGWALSYRPRREFAFRRATEAHEDKERWARVWDCFGFFQSSFVSALEKWGVGSPAMIERMKAERSRFTWNQYSEIRNYCFAECDALVELMDQLRTAAETAGIALTRWDGAGALAASMLTQRKMKKFHAPYPPRTVEQRAAGEAARCAYYGGRIECIQWGEHRSSVHAYDLRSAYPAALANLPCLSCGVWEMSNREPGFAWQVHAIEWQLDGDALPFPWRARDGRILYARMGRGWYWESEVSAAYDALARGIIRGRVNVVQSYQYRPGCAHDPWRWIPSVYATREKFLAEKNAAEKPLKLGLNSLYGKCAQRAGAGGRKPAHQQLVWASLTTSLTRAELYRASWPAIEARALIAYATDSILTTVPLDLPAPQPGTPGGWTAEHYTDCTMVMPGIYWLGDRTVRSRGWRSAEISRERIRQAWQAREQTISMPVTRFIGLGAALARRDPSSVWRQWVPVGRTLALHPIGPKRMLPPRTRWDKLKPWQQLVRTIPSDCARFQRHGLESTPLVFAPWQAGVRAQSKLADMAEFE